MQPPPEDQPVASYTRAVAELVDVTTHPLQLPPPPVRRGRSGGLVVTFLLGVGVGAAVCYGLLSASGVALPNPGVGVEQPGQAAIPVPEQPTDELADINGFWPARHIVLVLDEAKPSPETLEVIGAFKPGAVRISPTLVPDAAEMQQLADALRRAVGRTGLPVIIAADAGNPNPLAEGPPPAYFSLGAVGDPAAATDAGASYARAAKVRGFNAVMAPWTSLAASGQHAPTLSWTADPTQSASLVLAYIDGVQSEGVLPIAMAFPASGLALPTGAALSTVGEQELRLLASHMVPLREAAAGGVEGVLVAHTSVPVLDKRFPERPATLSPTLVGGILRDKWKFGGVVIASDLTPLGEQLQRPVEELFVESLAAGCDAVMLSKANRTTMRRVCAQLLALVNAQALDPAALDASKARLNRWQETLAAFQQRSQQQSGPAPQPEQTELLRHTVQPGETLITISRQYNVRVSDVKIWNGLAESAVTPGQKLNIYLPKSSDAAPPADAQQESVEAMANPETSEELAPPETPAPETQAEPKEEEKKETAPPTEKPEPKEPRRSKVEVPLQETAPAPAPVETTAPAEAMPSPPSSPAPVPQAAPLVPVGEEAPAPATKEPSTEEPKPVPKDGKFHVWAEGDTLESVAQRYGVSTEQLKEWNFFDAAPPSNGMEVVVVESAAKKADAPAPDAPTATHTVKTGDTLHRIAQQYGTSKAALVKLNGLEREDLIWVGQRLKVPAK